MGLLDRSNFDASIAGQVLRRIAEGDPGGAPPDALGLDARETAALRELERLGLVALERGAGPMAWRVERVRVTDQGRAKLAQAADKDEPT